MVRLCLFLPLLLLSGGLQALELNGFTRFGDEVKLNVGTAGVVKKILVKPGQRVAIGDVLLRLDDRLHRARLARARAQAERLKPNVDTAELELERAQELYDRDSLSSVALQQAEGRLAEARGAWQAALAEQEIAEYELERTKLHAPLAGRVLEIDVGVGQYVDPAIDASSLVTLAKTNRMRGVGTISSEQWSDELVGQKAQVTYRGKRYAGQVEQIGLSRTRTGSGLSGYELSVDFETDRLIPADMPVVIEITE